MDELGSSNAATGKPTTLGINIGNGEVEGEAKKWQRCSDDDAGELPSTSASAVVQRPTAISNSIDSMRRENILFVRLAAKEQEVQDCYVSKVLPCRRYNLTRSFGNSIAKLDLRCRRECNVSFGAAADALKGELGTVLCKIPFKTLTRSAWSELHQMAIYSRRNLIILLPPSFETIEE